jgi:hypothetical protein
VFFGLGEAIPLDQVKAGDFVFGPTELIPALPAGRSTSPRIATCRPGSTAW